MATMTYNDRKIDLDWLTADVIRSAIKESEEHPTRQAFIQNANRCWKYYSESISSSIPVGDDDELIDNTEYPVSHENRIKKSVNDAISILLKNNPIVRHYPHANKPSDGELADEMDEILAAVWRPDGGNIASLIQACLLEACISGLGVSKIYWDRANVLFADGQVAGDKVIHKDLFLDVYATNSKRALDCRYIIHRTWHTEEYVKQRYGTVKADSDKKRGAIGERWSRFANFAKQTLNKPLGGGGSDDPYDQYDPRKAVYEAWFFPTVSSDWNLLTGDTIDERDFPFGIVATMVDEAIVNVRPNPNATEKSITEEPDEMQQAEGIYPSPKTHILGSKRHPFCLTYWQPGDDEDGDNRIYCAEGSVANMIAPQTSYNSLSMNTQINAVSMANPAKVVVDGAMKKLPPDRIVCDPGAIYVEERQFAGKGIRNLEGAQLPAYVFTLREQKKEAISELGGVNMLMTGLGDFGTSHMPGMTLAGLQQASFAPLLTPVKELSNAIYDKAILIEGLMQQHYEPGRFIDVSDKGERRFLEWKEANILANFNRIVVAGSTTPMDDLDRDQKVAEITAATNEALMTNDKYLMLSTILYLKNLNKAYAHDWIQLLQQKIAELDQIKQGLQEVGMQQVGQQMQAAQTMPTGDMGDQDIDSLLAELNGELGG